MKSPATLTLLVLMVSPSAGLLAQEYTWQRVAKAEPDECYNGFGQPYLDISRCDGTGVPKRNHTYPWGMALAGQRIWIGTGANVTHIARAAVGQGSPLDTPDTVAEYAASQYPGVLAELRPLLGDWRPPQVWIYDIVRDKQINVTPDDPLLGFTLGLRSAGANNGVVILAGPTLLGLGINLFAFDAATLRYLGSKTMWQYSSIRKWVVADKVMYAGVQDTFSGGGSVLRWRGNRWFPFLFEVVGVLDNDVANLAFHDGRLYAGTWAATSLSSLASLVEFISGGEPAAIWMSPPIRRFGLSRIDSAGWTKVWSATDYEPDEVIARAYGIGEMASFGGYLYWGTMNPPFSGFGALAIAYGAPQDPLAAQMFSNRAVSVFRARRLGNPPVLFPKILAASMA